VPDPSLLLLIPAYNEERRIEPVLRDYARFFQENYTGNFQIVVVLNGCTDNTIGVVRRVAAEFLTLRALEFKAPIGKGGALIEGLKLAGFGDLIGYVDADGATTPAAFLELVRHIGDADCVVGSRWLPESHCRPGLRHQPAGGHQTGRLPHPRGADRVDGQGRLKSHVVIISLVADDAPFRLAHPADLFAALRLAAAAGPAGRLDL